MKALYAMITYWKDCFQKKLDCFVLFFIIINPHDLLSRLNLLLAFHCKQSLIFLSITSRDITWNYTLAWVSKRAVHFCIILAHAKHNRSRTQISWAAIIATKSEDTNLKVIIWTITVWKLRRYDSCKANQQHQNPSSSSSHCLHCWTCKKFGGVAKKTVCTKKHWLLCALGRRHICGDSSWLVDRWCGGHGLPGSDMLCCWRRGEVQCYSRLHHFRQAVAKKRLPA